MHGLSLSAVPQWTVWNNYWCPQSVDTLCPHCGRAVTFALANYGFAHHSVIATARCPGCGEVTRFFAVDPGEGNDSSKRGCAYLGVHPNPRTTRKPIVSSDKLENQALARTYEAALKAYNAGLWDACATSCRKTLEGIVHTLLPDEDRKGSLFEQLKQLPVKVDLSEPLVALADALRKGGNIAAHFNLEQAPDQSVAEIMVDLLDYFMEYVYVLKERAQELEKRLDSLRDSGQVE